MVRGVLTEKLMFEKGTMLKSDQPLGNQAELLLGFLSGSSFED